MVYFAEVEIEADLTSPFNIRWNESTIRLQIGFNAAIKEGFASAYNCHLARGGANSAFTIEDMLISDVDTTPATVTVAATVAAWMALGHDESAPSLLRSAIRSLGIR